MESNNVSQPHVDVVIITWNHHEHIVDCLEALLTQDYPVFRVTVLDNASMDRTVEQIEAKFPTVMVLREESNTGFSKALNRAIKNTEGEYILSLNPDVIVRPDFISRLVEAMADQRIGFAAPKLLRADDPQLLDSTGLFLDSLRRPVDRGQLEVDKGQYDGLRVIFGACGAAALYRREMLHDLAIHGEIFDEDFFAYYEDADLSWRAQQLGWKGVFAPEAIATHERGWGDTVRKVRGKANPAGQGPRLALRNYLLMLQKNPKPRMNLWERIRTSLYLLVKSLYLLALKPTALNGWIEAFRLKKTMASKRDWIRKKSVLSDRDLREWFTHA
ncbi:MAG TPA: glycosyltransferase family 2 protein [Bellilinea sp.]|nr:glycosyltransferase family 2 protein [Bellilinea sp.]